MQLLAHVILAIEIPCSSFALISIQHVRSLVVVERFLFTVPSLNFFLIFILHLKGGIAQFIHRHNALE